MVFIITLYTTGCPRCKVLESKLREAGFSFGVVDNQQKIIEMGFTTVPVMTVDGTIYQFKEAVEWINAHEVENGH